MEVSYLLHADDALIFCDAKRSHIFFYLNLTLSIFEALSRKSRLYRVMLDIFLLSEE